MAFGTKSVPSAHLLQQQHPSGSQDRTQMRRMLAYAARLYVHQAGDKNRYESRKLLSVFNADPGNLSPSSGDDGGE